MIFWERCDVRKTNNHANKCLRFISLLLAMLNCDTEGIPAQGDNVCRQKSVCIYSHLWLRGEAAMREVTAIMLLPIREMPLAIRQTRQ
jgi:hypothetical protein